MRICPTDVITVSMKDNPKFAEKESTRRKIVDEFELNIADCIMCGLCVDYCNFDAIVMSDNFELSKASRTQLVQGLDELLDGGRDQVARGRWSAPETKKSQRRAAAPTPTAGEVDPRVAAGRAKAAELRAQKAAEREAAGAEAGTPTAAQPASTESTETDQPAVDPRVVEGRRKAAELRAQKAAEREAAGAEAGTPTAAQPASTGTIETDQPAVDPRVVEGRRKAAELRAQKAREREEQQASNPSFWGRWRESSSRARSA
jgi:ferredoxin